MKDNVLLRKRIVRENSKRRCSKIGEKTIKIISSELKLVSIPGSINPVGREIKKINDAANVIEDNKSKRIESHSVTAAL